MLAEVMFMENSTFDEIKELGIKKLKDKYTYYGIAASNNFVLITAGDIKITIKIEK